MLTPAFRRRLFLHQDGFISSLVLGALQERELPDLLLQRGSLTIYEMAQLTSGNPGYLHVAMRCLAQQGWLARTGTPGTAALIYSVTELGRAVGAIFPLYCRLARFLRRHLPFERSLLANPDAGSLGELSALVDEASKGWSLPPELREAIDLQSHLDGNLAVPIMLALWSMGALAPSAAPSAEREGMSHVMRFLQYLGWFDGTWTDEGRIASDHALHYGMVGSYSPMLVQLPTLLFGKRDHRTHVVGQEESHVDRRMNVLASSAAHRRYFVDADDIFADIFNREPISEQPDFIADNGCGDGSWLKHIYELIAQRTRRGKHLSEHPLLMVGVDYNDVALEIARKTLRDASIPSKLLFGDVTDPDRFAKDLLEQGLDIRRGLHIRAFIDHNRRYQPPPDGVATLADRSSGAYVDEAGEPISNHLLEQELVVFLRRWAPYVARHGMVVLEAHCLDPRVAANHVGEVHHVVFDTYHGFSSQYPIDFEAFMEAAQAAGFEPVMYQQKRYPSRKPFVSIGINHFIVPKQEDLLPRSPGPVQRPGEWQPDGREDLRDGEALHRLLYRGGDLRHPRSWCAGTTALLVLRALTWLERRLDEIQRGERPPAISIMDYGTGSGLAPIELLKACKERHLLRRIEELEVTFDLHLLDVPSSWFAKGYELLKDCPYVRFWSLTSPDGTFLPLSSVVGGRSIDLALASMVFHLIPRRALPRVFQGIADVLSADGRLLWSSPDIGPASSCSVVFHEPNRRLRRRALEILEDPSRLNALLERLPAGDRWHYQDLPARLEAISQELTPHARAAAQRTADRQILPAPTDVGDIESSLKLFFTGETFARSFEMRAIESLDAILVPSNQRFLLEIDDPETRRRLTALLMTHDIMPALCWGPAGSTYGFSVHWTFGEHARRRGEVS